MFFHDWGSIGRVVVVAACVYLALVVILRLVGEQALSKMSAYDLIFSVALGSLVAAIPLTTGLSLADGLAAILTYLVLQEATRRLVKRVPGANKLVMEGPHVVLWDGRIVRDGLDAVNATEDQVRAAVRSAGKASLSDVLAVVLENDGAWSVVPRSDAKDYSALEGLEVPGLIDNAGDARRGARPEPELADRLPAARREHPAPAARRGA